MVRSASIQEAAELPGAFRAIAGGLFGADDAAFVAVFRAYLDSSSADEIVTVGGYVSTIDQWERLAPDWNAILEQQGVVETDGYRCLHMKDLTAGRRGFPNWTNEQSKALFSRLEPLLNTRVCVAVSRSVSTAAFNDAMAVLAVRFPGVQFQTVLSFTVIQTLHTIASWCSHRGINGPQMGYFFEAGDPRETVREITETMNDVASNPAKAATYRIAGWGFGSKRLVPLQAADWLAYEAHLYGKRHVLPQYGHANVSRDRKGRPRAVRRSFEKLLGNAPEQDVKWLSQRDGVLQVARFNYALIERGDA